MKMKFNKYLLNEKKYSTSTIKKIVDEASMDFWARVAEMVPEADSGDLDPGTNSMLEKAMAKAVKEWIDFNVPK